MASEDHRIYYPKKIIKMAKGIDPRGIKKGIGGQWQYNNVSGNEYPQFFKIYGGGEFLNARGATYYSAPPQPVNKVKAILLHGGRVVYKFDGGSDIDLSVEGSDMDLSNVVGFYEPTIIPIQNR